MRWQSRQRWPQTRLKPATPLDAVGFLSVDLETSGLDPRRHAIVSVGWVALDGLAIAAGSAGALTVRSTGLSEDIGARFHGLGHDAVAAGVPLSAMLAAFQAAAHGRVLIAHGAAIEREFLAKAFRRCALPAFAAQIVDTLALEQRRPGDRGPGRLRLDACRHRYNLPRYKAHDALSDALACAELFLAQQAHAGWKRLGQVLTG